MRKLTDLLLILGFVVLCCGCSSKGNKEAEGAEEAGTEAQTQAKEEDRGYIVKVGDMAPDFTVELTDGTSVTLSSLRGKVVMLQFTASWCGVCRKEMPFIERDIWQRHKDDDFYLMGVDRDEPLETVLSMVEKTGVTYPMALDPKGGVFSLYAEKNAGITRNVLIDRDGRIVMLTRLYDEEEFRSLVDKIDSLF